MNKLLKYTNTLKLTILGLNGAPALVSLIIGLSLMSVSIAGFVNGFALRIRYEINAFVMLLGIAYIFVVTINYTKHRQWLHYISVYLAIYNLTLIYNDKNIINSAIGWGFVIIILVLTAILCEQFNDIENE